MTEPVELAGSYYATAVNGNALPVRRIDWFSNSAGSCERDLDAADLSFSGEARFELYLHYTRRCTTVPPTRSSSSLKGTYTRNGADLHMQSTTSTSEAIRDSEVRGRNVIIVIRLNNTDFQLRFEPR